MAFAATAATEATSDAEHWTARAVALIALCFVINMADGVDVTILSYIAPRLQDEWRIDAGVMGYLFSAGLIGMAIGGMLIAPLADRHGRRRVILAALLLMSSGMLASGAATGPAMLFALRVVVGAGIGTVLATMAALAAEVAPAAQRNLAVGMVQAGYPFAAIFTGLVSAALLPAYGWRFLLTGAGVLSALIIPAAWLLLPSTLPGATTDRGRVSALFDRAMRARTLALWCAVFSGLMVLYFIVSWIPKLSIQAGLSETDGIYAGAVYSGGAFIGTCLMSFAALRYPLGRLVPAMLIAAAMAMLVFGNTHLPVTLTMALAFVIGVLLQGGYNGVWPLAAGAYPSAIRATGVGWAIGIGRSGAIIGPWLGGMLMTAHVPLGGLFAAFCVPLLLCASAVSMLRKSGTT